MKVQRIFWKIYPGYLVVTVMTLVALFIVSTLSISRFYHARNAESLRIQALFAGEQARTAFQTDQIQELRSISHILGDHSSARLTFILPDGTVAGDSDSVESEMENHGDRPEIKAAFLGQVGQSDRYSDTLQKNMMYVAVPVIQSNEIVCVVRTSMPLTEMDHAIDAGQRGILFGGLLILLLAAILSLWGSRHISRPLANTMSQMELELEERLQSLNRMENIRRDFVANVSHELKTPITAIKGFVETLLDGAVKNPVDADRFLNIVSKHSNRLNAIIEDLLMLSRLEQEGPEGLEMYPATMVELIQSAIEVCAHRAENKNITIQTECTEGLNAQINPPLIEQALINLISNAVKYSPADKTVTVTAYSKNKGIILSVIDQGYGIEPEHQERLFERFYRIDKGRSRSEGGTGLGLAIVKHIAQVHGGRVSVQSIFGYGSTFSIVLPTTNID